MGYHTVAVGSHLDPVITLLTIDGEVIETTPEHPFLTLDRGWVGAGELRVGEHVREVDGETGIVEAVAAMHAPQRMYNLTVAEAHTYAVGDQQWVVHNTCDDLVDLADPARRRHILDGDATGGGHRPGTGKPGKSEFPADWSDDDIMHAISDIATDPKSTVTPGRDGRRVMTGTRNGLDITVIVEANGDIVTAWPTNLQGNP
jgi:hypothetical protein